eukprot:INCI1380.3.p1 GENE.INCI1380.3~~INCI1380.3.p1  ORF type:complete len:100 (+),score=33.59 INCI1380.3:154-453(+)
MSEKRKASGGLVPEDVAEEKKVKGSPKAQDSGTSAKVDEKLGTVSLDNIEEDDEFQEFEVYTWDTAQAQKPDSLDFQDNWDEDANDKDFVAQLRKELSK